MQEDRITITPFSPTSTLSIPARRECLLASSLLPAARQGSPLAPRQDYPVFLNAIPVCLRTPSNFEVLNHEVVDQRCGVHAPGTQIVAIVIDQAELERPEHETLVQYRYRDLEPVLCGAGGKAWQHPLARLRNDAHLAHLIAVFVFAREGNWLSRAEEHALFQGAGPSRSSIEKFELSGSSKASRPKARSSSAKRGAGPPRSRQDEPREEEANDAGMGSPEVSERVEAARAWDNSVARKNHGLPCFEELEGVLQDISANDGHSIPEAMIGLLNKDNSEEKCRSIAERLVDRMNEITEKETDHD